MNAWPTTWVQQRITQRPNDDALRRALDDQAIEPRISYGVDDDDGEHDHAPVDIEAIKAKFRAPRTTDDDDEPAPKPKKGNGADGPPPLSC